jgi:hypothetical protein
MGPFMAHPQSGFPRAGGFLLALSILLGVVVGSLLNQPSIGFIAGTGIGLLLLLAVWLSDRSRRR